MFVKKVELDVDARRIEDFPKPLKSEVIFLGRSNVGKSSLLNALFGRKMAKTSSTPGKTRSLVFFKINEKYHLVDFPGYGYAKISKAERQRWSELIESYFTTSRPRKASFLLVDSRIPIQKSDMEAYEWLLAMEERVIIVSTKIDKVKNNDLIRKMKEMEKVFAGAEDVIPVSTVSRKGLKELDSKLRYYVER